MFAKIAQLFLIRVSSHLPTLLPVHCASYPKKFFFQFNISKFTIKLGSCLLLIGLLLGNLSASLPVKAVETVPTNTTLTGNTNQTASYVNIAKSIGFKECTFGYQDPKQGNDAFQRCLKQIFNFFFVAGIFFVAIRIAVEALGSLNPFEKGKAVDNSVKLIGDVVIGLLLLGAPGLFLQFFNPSALNINIISSLVPSSNQPAKNNQPSTTIFSKDELTQATTAGTAANAKLIELINNSINDLQGANVSPVDIQKLTDVYKQADQNLKDYINSRLPSLNPTQTANIRYLPGSFNITNNPILGAPGNYRIHFTKISDDYPSIVSPQEFYLYATPINGTVNGCEGILALGKDTIRSAVVNASTNCKLSSTNNL